MNRDRLVIFTRYPEPGRTKTRLVGVLGAQGAADLQKAMTERTVQTARRVRARIDVDVEICFDGGKERRMRRWLGADLHFRRQTGADLGERMSNAFRAGFRAGGRRIVLVGADCPKLTVEVLQGAFQALERHEVVIGPARDGGYYLIGLTGAGPDLFRGIPWGTDRVLPMALERLESAGISWALGDELVDVDTAEDLAVWEEATGKGRPSISVIIPTLNEAAHLADTIRSARQGNPLEILVVDGGSGDGTTEIARQNAARVLLSTPGRARQMNTGAAVASGDILLFLHADTILPERYPQHVCRVLADGRTACGAFRFRIVGDFPGKRFVEAMTAFRSRCLAMPYGDQSLFLRRNDFVRLGGFKDLAIMEDYDFVLRARRLGCLALTEAAVLTSARRWQRLGVLRTTIVNQIMIAGYRLGVSPERLAAFYRKTPRSMRDD